uniref:Uncharacterized protein n=1 Tax=Ceratitis capitata TaxID=7213 RepID=W8AY48_CERCA
MPQDKTPQQGQAISATTTTAPASIEQSQTRETTTELSCTAMPQQHQQQQQLQQQVPATQASRVRATTIGTTAASTLLADANTNTNTTTTTETISSVVIENSSNTTATETNQTEKQTINNTATTLAAETPESAPAAAATVVVSNGDAIEKNGIDTLSTAADQKDQVTVKAAADLIAETSDVADKIKSIPNVVNELSDNNGVHQNGTSANGEELEPEIESKSQVEDITNAKDLKESAAAEVTTQDLPVICE